MKLNKYIDHTLLKPESKREEIEKLCKEAIEYDFATVCVNPYWVRYCERLLKHSDVGITTVIGFPLGATTTKAKVAETEEAILNGADEIDMVINIGALKSYDYEGVRKDIKSVVEAAAPHTVKVILETCLLTEKEIAMACELAEESGAKFVKTSTGFGEYGAKLDDVKLMKESVSKNVKVKASGGIRDYKTAMEMINAGAERLGVSAGVSIMKEALEQ
ncbi:MAG: deoxyribose-phosphate aldolase [Tissierellia bacterium]|nr:deoxyribose-phosphate aldolase [Tissierellia bacterium]